MAEDEDAAMLEEPGPLEGALVEPEAPSQEEEPRCAEDAPRPDDVVTGGPEAPPLELLTAPLDEDAVSFSPVVQACSAAVRVQQKIAERWIDWRMALTPW